MLTKSPNILWYVIDVSYFLTQFSFLYGSGQTGAFSDVFSFLEEYLNDYNMRKRFWGRLSMRALRSYMWNIHASFHWKLRSILKVVEFGNIVYLFKQIYIFIIFESTWRNLLSIGNTNTCEVTPFPPIPASCSHIFRIRSWSMKLMDE